MNVKFIINQNSGSGLSPKQFTKMQKYFQRQLGTFDYTAPADRDSAIRATRQLIKDGAEQIVAVGGDGTVNAIANGFFEDGKLVNKDALLTISDAGGGCDYYSSITREYAPKSWMEIVLNHDARAVDVGLIGYSNTLFTHKYFLNMASVGMVADIVSKREKGNKLIPPALQYILPTISSLLHFKPIWLKIVTDYEELEVEALAVTISKGAFAGKGMRFGLDVALNDGKFEVTIFKFSSAIRMIYKLRKIYSGKYASDMEIRKIKTSRIEIESTAPPLCEFDGELYGDSNLNISIAPESIQVCFPVCEAPEFLPAPIYASG